MTAGWTVTRDQLIDALANIEVRGVKVSGPVAGLVVAEDMAGAILAQLPAGGAQAAADALLSLAEGFDAEGRRVLAVPAPYPADRLTAQARFTAYADAARMAREAAGVAADGAEPVPGAPEHGEAGSGKASHVDTRPGSPEGVVAPPGGDRP